MGISNSIIGIEGPEQCIALVLQLGIHMDAELVSGTVKLLHELLLLLQELSIDSARVHVRWKQIPCRQASSHNSGDSSLKITLLMTLRYLPPHASQVMYMGICQMHLNPVEISADNQVDLGTATFTSF